MKLKNIIYWKWDSSVLDNLEQEISDFLTRCSFELVYIKFDDTHLPYFDERLKKSLYYAAETLRNNGRELILDIDPRGFSSDFLSKNPKRYLRIMQAFEGTLDELGQATVVLENDEWEPIKAWTFMQKEQGVFIEDTVQIPTVEIAQEANKKVWKIYGEQKNANNKYLILAAKNTRNIDLFSDECDKYYDEMFRHFSDVPASGAGTDEWGLGVECSVEQWVIVSRQFFFSDIFCAKFHEEYGFDLLNNALYLFYSSNVETGKSNQIISSYIGLIRKLLCLSNDRFYDNTKRYFGKNAFIAAHPTMWGDAYDFSFDVISNGLHWWEMRRDVAQTDEYVLIPIRMALSRKWNDSIWYNMWYGMGSPHLITCFAEAWNNLRFGGKVHYLAWECKREKRLYQLKNPSDEIEQVEKMESRIGEAFSHIQSVPDSSVLIVFSMDAVSNWLNSYGKAEIRRGEGKLHRVLEITQGIFSAYNCDLIPTTEIENNSVYLKDGDIYYCKQKYETVIVLYPELLSSGVIEFLSNYAKGGNLILAGSKNIAIENAKYCFEEMPSIPEFIDCLNFMQVSTHRIGGGCEYRDGTLVFTANATLPIDNYFETQFVFQDKFYTFKGYDYLILKPDGEYYCGKNSILVAEKLWTK